MIAAAAAGFFMLRRRRNMGTRQPDHHKPELDAQSSAKPHLNAAGYATSKSGWSEMPADGKVHEKDGAPVALQTTGELEAPRF